MPAPGLGILDGVPLPVDPAAAAAGAAPAPPRPVRPSWSPGSGCQARLARGRSGPGAAAGPGGGELVEAVVDGQRGVDRQRGDRADERQPDGGEVEDVAEPEATYRRPAVGSVGVLVQEPGVTGDDYPQPAEGQAHGEHGGAVDGGGDVRVGAGCEVLGHQVG